MLWACGRRACVVHKSTAAAFRLSEAIAGVMSDSAKHDRSVGDGPAIRVLGEADRLADEGSTDVDRVASPLDLAVVADTHDCSFAAVFRRAQDAVPGSRRDAIVLSGRVVAERLVRALFIVQQGLRTPTGPFSENCFIVGIRGSGCEWRSMRRSTRPTASSSAAR